MKKILLALGVFVLLGLGGAISYTNGNAVSSEDIMYMVSHSEYWSGEEGQIIARLYDWQGSPITVDNCTVDIWYPDKTSFISGALTDDSLQATTGTHFYNFTTPDVEGVYQYMVTCSYPNQKVRSVANSFHLSPALNFIRNVNDSITALTAQELEHFNTMQDNFSFINGELVVIQDDLTIVKANLTDIHDDTNYIRENMLTETLFLTNISTVINNQDTIIGQGNDILNNLTAIEQFCDTATTSGSSLCLWVDEIRSKVGDINSTVNDYSSILSEINSTTHSTYDYMTGTLATNINNIATDVTTILGVVNRVETNTQQINSTVNTIEQNQEDVVYMEVTS